MDTTKYVVKSTSYQNIYESFLNLFPEFKRSIKEWNKDIFGKYCRTIVITLKNGIRIRFGCAIEECDPEWVWSAYAFPSEKSCERLNIGGINDDDYIYDLGHQT